MNHALERAFVVIWISMATLHAQAPRAAVAGEPVRSILEALRSHQVVGLGLGAHNNEQGHAFLLSLVRHPEFPASEADLVVECGNALYQDVMDRFISGEEIPDESLRRIWQDTTQPHAGCDVPIHEELYRTMRSVNAALPAQRRIRVLLGDPPVDWNSPTAKQDRSTFMAMRASHPAQVIQKAVLAKRRRAVVVYGQMHLQRAQMATNYDMSHPIAQTVVSLLAGQGVSVFTVWGNSRADLAVLQPSIADWTRPSLALVRGTVLGAADFEFFYGAPLPRVLMKSGQVSPVPREEWRALRMEEQFDAVLYLGPPSTMTTAELPRARCADVGYMTLRLGRLEAEGPKSEADRLRQYCAASLK
jgi:hypothetical protein